MNDSETLSAGQECCIVLSAVALLKKQIRGGTQNIIFTDPDAPYLASCPEKIQEDDTDELTTISIHEAIVLSTKTLLRRTKQVDVVVTTATLQRIYDRVMLILNEKLGPVVAHPIETKEIIQKIEQMESDINMIIHYLEQIFDNYYQTDDREEKNIYGRLIDTYMQILIEKKGNIQELSEIYSLPGEFYEGDSAEARPHFTPPNTGFLPVKMWTGDDDEGGGLEDIVGSELVIEDIAFSEAESALYRLCPKDFLSIDELFQENFSWNIVGAEKKKEKSKDINDHPHVLEKKYRIMLRRKQTIYFYITKILLNKIQKRGRTGYFMTAIIGLRSMTHFLPILRNEIDELTGKIKNISPIPSEEEEIGDAQGPIDGTEKKLQDLKEKKNNALRNRDTYLSSFFYMPEASELLTPMLEMLHAQIAFFTKKIDDYSGQIYGPKNVSTDSSETSLEDRTVVHINRLYNDPQFFQEIPQTIEAPLTPVECELIEMCDIGEAVTHFEKVGGMTAKNNIYTHDETDQEGQMEWLLVLFEMIISRKMFLYSQALPFTYEVDMDHPIHDRLEELREETRVAEMSRNILTRRVNCENYDALKGSEIMTEIDELWYRRFHQLKFYFTQQENAQSRNDITEALSNTIEALLERWQDRDNLELEYGDGEGTISLPEMSPEEESLLQYVPEEIRKNDPIFHDTISYHIYPDGTPAEERKERQHLFLTHLCERLLIIYFFAQSNIDIIDSEMAIGKQLADKQTETISGVREKIETSLEPLKKIILDHLATLGGYRKAKKIETPIHIYNKSRIIHSQLDGLRAHVDDPNKDTINECYEMIQKVVHHFSYDVYKNKAIGNNQARSIQLRHRREIKKILIEITNKLREKMSQKEAEIRIDFMEKIVKRIDRVLFSPKALIEDIHQQSIGASNTEEN